MAPKKDNGKPTQPPASAATDPPGPDAAAKAGADGVTPPDEDLGTAKAGESDDDVTATPPIFDPEWLEGLTFSTGETMVLDGETKKRIVTRPLELDDVLTWANYDDAVVLVTADGQKHRVEK